ncbi:GMC family oxidoreductase [Pseudomonas aeruginosa]|uniref:GMC family oxidoreductase n=1 Tax=Pseudomonas aeruginosa TaxID=287 RepID=UPI0008FBBAC3|nr:choline dehydrogenase [Pseudomonas aeruginosa]KSR18223.2 GMC family oxidoreductase [Pseudomonas aeruginosa]RMK37961.1 GMC family oxidoreductase [Pseudomonas aeruginosa]
MYDYIIVGAGSAGCVLANRLSADPSKRVCLLEAGPRDTNPLIHMPLGIALLSNSKKLNWAFQTAPQQNLNGRSLFWPRGKTLGGSSSINAMVYIRGHEDDYHAWEQAAGRYWGWYRALELFKRLECNQRFDKSEHHGVDGELAVSDLKYINPLSKAFVQAGMEANINFNGDFNGEYQDGVGFYQVTQKNGQRWSSARAFLHGVLSRPNLDIITDAHASKILFEDRKAVGVSYIKKNMHHQVKTTSGGEVLLSLGAVGTPHLLMLSGVGAAAELKEHGVSLVHDLPEVGKNLQDHLDITLMCAANSREPIGVALSFIPRGVSGLFSYVFKREGFLTSNVAESGGFVKSSPDRDRPNLQFHFLPTYLKDHGRKIAGGYGYTLHICDLLPKSRGRIGLKSANPLQPPLIDPNYLSDHEDIKTMIAGIKIGRAILQAPSMAKHFKHEVVPGQAVKTDDEIIEDIRRRVETIYHPVGTCRMGKDPASVVDPCLKIRGLANIRVVDASIMPHLVAGNTNAPTIMIAENAAEIIMRTLDVEALEASAEFAREGAELELA